jgi:hypothetical protein
LALGACADEPPVTPPETLPLPANYAPPPAQVRRLLARQYVASVRELFGEAAALAALPPRDTSLNGFTSIAATQLAVSDELVARYERSALAVATAAMGNHERITELVGCTPRAPDDADCFRSFIARTGRLVWRRPLSDDEVNDYVTVAQTAVTQLGGFYDGVEFVIAALLESPNFLYQVELGEPLEGAPSLRRLDGYEIATRMSFALTDTTPSAWLLDAVEAGELATPDGTRRAAETLLAGPGARSALRGFFAEYLTLSDLPEVPKSPVEFPDYTPELAAAMKEETLRLVEDIVFDRRAPLSELFTASYTFVNADLARHYGVVAPADEVPWTKAALPSEQKRAGVLGHSSFLSVQSHPDSTSATHRGLFVMERFLCRSMPPPPPDVVTELPPSSEAPTLRERIAVHQEEESCRTCHYFADNIGLAFENYDATGAFRLTENGALIDPASAVSELGAFDGARTLGAILAQRVDVMECLVRNVFRHSIGHVEIHGERDVIEQLSDEFMADGLDLQELLVALVTSEAFRTVGIVEPEVGGAP